MGWVGTSPFRDSDRPSQEWRRTRVFKEEGVQDRRKNENVKLMSDEDLGFVKRFFIFI